MNSICFAQNICPTAPPDGWQGYMRTIGWEEAIRAWRIVHATLFCELHYFQMFTPNFLRRKFWKKEKEHRWFQPKKLIDEGTYYHAGSYLRTMNSVLHSMAFLCTVPLVIATVQTYFQKQDLYPWFLTLSVAAFAILLLRFLQDTVRRRLLEYGILSIHSCAVTWQAVVVAHYRSLRGTVEGSPHSFKGYTHCLSMQAKSLVENPFDIYNWVLSRQPRKKRK